MYVLKKVLKLLYIVNCFSLFSINVAFVQSGYTSLHLAAGYGNDEIVELLLKHTADSDLCIKVYMGTTRKETACH